MTVMVLYQPSILNLTIDTAEHNKEPDICIAVDDLINTVKDAACR
jgi:hypothetical protein